MRDINGRVAVVTGASMGIGAAIAHALAARGATVALIARGKDRLHRTAAEIGPAAHGYPCDMTDRAAILATVDRITTDLGSPTLLINNVGAGTFKPLAQMNPLEVATSIDLPFAAATNITAALIPSMIERREGHIVNLTSPAGYFPLQFMVPYTAGRHAMVGLSTSLREELAYYGIGVSLVCPAEVNTGYFEHNGADIGWYPKLAQWFPVLEPHEVADRTIRAIERNSRETVFPWQLKLVTAAYRRAPVISLALIKRLGLFQPRLPTPVSSSGP